MAFDLFERRQAALAVSTDEVGAHTVIAGISLTLEQQRAIETAGFSVSGERDTLQLFPHPDDSTLGLLADMHRVDLVDTRMTYQDVQQLLTKQVLGCGTISCQKQGSFSRHTLLLCVELLLSVNEGYV